MAYRETADVDGEGAVRSIRVATALVERFRGILDEVARANADASLVIGEAQQVYPEIWRHLDDARRALHATGRDTRVFDEMRKHELAQLGVTDIDSTTEHTVASLMVGALGTPHMKTATFNVEGYKRAIEACHALMATMPEVDWTALARAEAKEIAAAGSMKTSWARPLMWLAIVLGVVVVAYQLIGSEKSPSQSTVERVRTLDLPEGELREVAHERYRRRLGLRDLYARTCDRAVQTELAALLREDSEPDEASKLEREPCVIARPTCDGTKEAFADRIARDNGLVRTDRSELICFGVVLVIDDNAARGFAIELNAPDKDTPTKFRALRGIVAEQGGPDLVPMVAARTERLIGVADLDQDGSDDLVYVGLTTLVVARIEDGSFEDVIGPTIKPGCTIDVAIEGDVRDGRDGTRKLVVLGVRDDNRGGKPCPTPGLGAGRHFFGLVGGKLVRVD